MSFANSTLTDLVVTTLAHRSSDVADNVSDSTALLNRLKEKGKISPVSGGRTIYQPFTFAENGNFGWYSGYDTIATAPQDVISGAEFAWKQAAVAVTFSGLEEMENSGKEQIFDLVKTRISAAEATMKNRISSALYSDGTGSGGKELTGLGLAVPVTPSTGTYGGIDRATWTFWRSIAGTGYSGTEVSTTIQNSMNEVWVQLVRGNEGPDLIASANAPFLLYLSSLQSQQRFTNSKLADLGYQNVKYMNADVVLDGGIGGDATANTMFFLNTDYLHFRPHSKRNMVPLNPDRRYSVNQDATVALLGFMGNLTCSGAKFQGRLTIS